MQSIEVVAVEDEEYYSTRAPGAVVTADDPSINGKTYSEEAKSQD